MFTYVAPLCVVIAFSMGKELYDDIKRRIQDKKTNATLITILSKDDNMNFTKFQKKASELEIGDIIELTKDNRVPADIVVLKTFNENNDNQAFIRTDQLDGETDWKLRKAPESTHSKEEKNLINLNGFIQYEAPSKLIYNFEGVIKYKNDQGIFQKEPLNLENTMWATTVVASQKVIGIVIYTGKETRAQMNLSVPKLKVGVFDEEINRQNVYLFIIIFILSFLISSLKGFYSVMILNFIKFIILFSAIIPIALKVNLDIAKTWYSYIISTDESIPETIARNSNIPEELGRISYVFSDKTGTLTKNEMIFKRIAMETEQFGEESFESLKSLLEEECLTYDAPLLDVHKMMNNKSAVLKRNDNDKEIEINTNSNQNDFSDGSKSNKKFRRERKKIIRDTITSMVLCNNVTPTETGYQASSPDEVALVKFADTINMHLSHRTDKEIKMKDAAGNMEEFDVLANFPFSSDTKRMGIVLKIKNMGILFII